MQDAQDQVTSTAIDAFMNLNDSVKIPCFSVILKS